MNSRTKTLSVVSYITWIGWVVALCMSEKDDRLVRHHLNQALVINILETIGTILARMGGVFGILGEVVDIAVLVFFIMGIVRAVKMSDEPLPLIGNIHILN